MTDPRTEVAAAERWFVDHGLPYFVDDQRAAVARGLGRTRLVPVFALAVVVGVAGGIAVGALAGAGRGSGYRAPA